jgi:23S rRNA (uracil1939-C5)-methyltransferase
MEDSLRHIAKLDTEVLPVIKADKLNYYRNKVQIPVGPDKDGNAAAGFYSLRSHNIIPNCNCIIQNKDALPIVEAVIKWMNDFNIPPYNEINNTGAIRHIYIRVAEATGEIMVAIVINTRRVHYTNELVEALIPLGVKTVICNINREKSNVVMGDKNIILYGDGRITDILCGLKFSISIKSFYQVNHDQTEKLYKTAMDAANIKKEDTVFDIYCGIGTISLYAAKLAKKVIGIEIMPEAVEDAKNNAKLNEIDNAEFYCGDAGEVTQELISKGERADVVIIDPPRKGCDTKLIDQILSIDPTRIVYISCNPSTLARDLKYFN